MQQCSVTTLANEEVPFQLGTVCMMMLELMFTIIPRERERLTGILKHELTNENWEDYWQYLGELNSVQQCLQRAEDREKIRRLVFGKDGGSNSKASQEEDTSADTKDGADGFSWNK